MEPVALESIETELRRLFASEPRGEAATYLFGSVAGGEAGPKSDVDVAVLFAEEPPPTLEGMGFDLEADLQEHLGHPVQLVVLNRAPVALIHRVLRDGKLISNRDPPRRIRFEVRARNEYWDLLPILRRYWKLEEHRS